MEGKRYAVLLCAEDSEYVRKKYGGYFGVFIRMLAEEGETWDVYKVASGDFPEEDGDLDLYDGFVITGSCNDAHGNDAWIHRLITLIQKLDSMKKKILGICFGHQINKLVIPMYSSDRTGFEASIDDEKRENLSTRLFNVDVARGGNESINADGYLSCIGGKVNRSPTGWDVGVRSITLSSSSPLSPTSLMREIPTKAEIIAWSEKTGIEMFRFGDHIMGIQGHPEYTIDILLHLIDRLVQRDLILIDQIDGMGNNKDKLQEVKTKHDLLNVFLGSFCGGARAKVVLREPDREAWKKLCTSFLKSRS
ncbi:gamma-glutamyl peptidase 5-like [Prosopis cineraria]|uniref:gamma-glutamyl peptidase 5-like n=1 Tax=Prosopis cineraria TaxID=364024 RepID=UPI00240F62F8|nr:gamma-glutamyl peptidase 5-like [Prosopis cineraria]